MVQAKDFLRKSLKLIAIFLTIAGLTLFVTNLYKISSQQDSQSTLCPSDYSIEQCTEYLRNQRDKLEKERQKIEAELNRLKKQQASLQTRLQILKNEEKLLNLTIEEKEILVSIITKEVEILQENVDKIQKEIDSQTAEIEHTKASIKKYLLLNYSLQALPWEQLLLEGKIYNIFELIAYLNYSVTEYRSKLNYLTLLQKHIKEQQQILQEEQKKVLEKQNELNKELEELNRSKEELTKKKEEINNLLAEIERSYEEYQKRRDQLLAERNKIAQELINMLVRLYEQGLLPKKGDPVLKGTIIGFQGHTGCAFGSHLHFSILKPVNGTLRGIPVETDNLLIRSGRYLKSNRAMAPLKGAYITQNYHGGYSLDLVSLAEGYQGSEKYCKNKYEIAQYCSSRLRSSPWFQNLPTEGCFGLVGEGAPVYAILDGEIVYRGEYPKKGGSKYVVIYHPKENIYTYYFHLK